MWHAIELAAALAAVCAAQAAIDVNPHPLRRGAWNLLGLAAAFALGIAVLSSRTVADPVVRVGIVALGAYLLRWIITSVEDWLRGPLLMEPVRAADLAAAVERAVGLAPREAMKAARRALRDWEGETALAALARLDVRPDEHPNDFAARWDAESAAMLAEARALAERYGGATGAGRLSMPALRFMAQGLCLYRRESLERVLTRADERALARHSGRAHAAAALDESAARNPDMDRLGFLPPSDEGAEGRTTAFCAAGVLWPARGLARVGFAGRAWALGVAEAALLSYGLFAAWMDRGSWMVFLIVGVLVHIQAVMALGDFGLSSERPQGAGEKP